MSRGEKYSDAKVEQMRVLRVAGLSCPTIDKRLGLPKGAAYQALRTRHLLSTKFSAHHINPAGEHKRPPDDSLAERDRAKAAAQTLTAMVCGDPLPGRSALDKKRSNLAEPPLLDPDIKVGLSP